MPEDQPLTRGENRIYRLIDRGPIFLGLPIIQGALILAGTGVGYWPMKMIFGTFPSLLYVVAGGFAWAVLSFLNNQDKTFLPRFFLKISGVVMKESITSYVPSNQKIEVE